MPIILAIVSVSSIVIGTIVAFYWCAVTAFVLWRGVALTTGALLYDVLAIGSAVLLVFSGVAIRKAMKLSRHLNAIAWSGTALAATTNYYGGVIGLVLAAICLWRPSVRAHFDARRVINRT